jgi:hypothetical protein
MTMRGALADAAHGAEAPSQSTPRVHPNAEQDWPNRDGRIEFEVIHRDWLRGYRITVECIPLEDVKLPDGNEPEDWQIIT